MSILRRLGYYLAGLAIGLIVVVYINKQKNVTFDYLPNARTLKQIRLKEELKLSPKSQLIANELGLDSLDFSYILNKGDVDFDKSNAQQKPFPQYWIDATVGKKNQHDSIERIPVSLIIERRDSLAIVKKIYSPKLKATQHQIQNEYLTATFKTYGAEIISLKDKNREYLWQGIEKHWPRQSPVLFPSVGSIKEATYYYKNKAYKMPHHGFVRDYHFDVIEKTDTKIVFEFSSNEETKINYPFDFTFQLQYILDKNHLTFKYVVKNKGNETMYFGLGGHPAFNCPFEEGQTREEYSLVFDQEISPDSPTWNGNFINPKTINYFKESGIIEVSQEIFDGNTVTFAPNMFKSVSLIHKPTGNNYMSVHFKDSPYLGIWTMTSKSPYLCIEPWYGIADYIDHNQQWTEKEGINTLDSGKNFSREFMVEINTEI